MGKLIAIDRFLVRPNGYVFALNASSKAYTWPGIAAANGGYFEDFGRGQIGDRGERDPRFR